MDYFKNFVSATPAAMGTQTFFNTGDSTKLIKSRVYAKLAFSGELSYSLLYSNIVDSTFADGKHSSCNRIIKPFEFVSARAGIVDFCGRLDAVEPECFVDITFDGKSTKNVSAGEIFHTDEFILTAQRGQYICIETVVRGDEIPYHAECLQPVFIEKNGQWEYSQVVPVPSMVGARKQVKQRIAFWGDSITQGCGTPAGKYEYYAGRISDALGEDYAVWDIAFGYARGNDAATNGSWMYRAKQNDIVSVCFGVNDNLNGYNEFEICKALASVVRELKNNGCKVLLQTMPQFSWDENAIDRWQYVNDYIRNTLSREADCVFDNTVILGEDDNNPIPKYGAHPDSEGHRVWSEALLKTLKNKFDIGE